MTRSNPKQRNFVRFCGFLGFIVLILMSESVSQTESALSPSMRYLTRNGQRLFLNGANLAWKNYANDISDGSNADTLSTFTDWFGNLKAAGGNSVRWWVHVNGKDTPQWTNGLVSGMGSNRIDRIKKILDAAASKGVLVELCLWSFDMWDPKQLGSQQYRIDQNEALFRNQDARNAYINNALKPLVSALKGHPGLLGYDIINEPEGMVDGWSRGNCGSVRCPNQLTGFEIQRFVNQLTGAIRSVDPNCTVTVGASIAYHVSKKWYNDDALISAGGDPKGVLTHHSVHYYPWNWGTSLSPFHNGASNWGLSKPIVIGESPAAGFCLSDSDLSSCGKSYKFDSSQKQCITDNYKNAHRGEYAGFLSWMYKFTSGCDKKLIGDWNDLKAGVQAIASYPCVSLTDSSCSLSGQAPSALPPASASAIPLASASASALPLASASASKAAVPSTPAAECTNLCGQTQISTSSASEWVVRNGWGLGDSSTLSSSNLALTLTTRQWARNFDWIINSNKTYCLEGNRNYSVSFKLVEDPANQIYNSSLECSTGCTGTTIEAISIDFISSFTSDYWHETGIEESLLNLKCEGEVWFSPQPTKTQPAVSVNSVSVFTVKFTTKNQLQNVSFGVLIELFGKPSKINKYTLSDIVVTKE